jgi:hypothetical protein
MADSAHFDAFNELARFDSFGEDFFRGFDLRSVFGLVRNVDA